MTINKIKNVKKYIALFETCEGCDSVGVVFPDLPGCFSSGNTYEEAFILAHEALSFHVSSMKSDGEQLPKPRTLEEIKATWESWREWETNYNFIVGYITLFSEPENYTTLTITLPNYLVAQIDQVAKKRSRFLADAAKAYLGIR